MPVPAELIVKPLSDMEINCKNENDRKKEIMIVFPSK
jgi:hypothetical protein